MSLLLGTAALAGAAAAIGLARGAVRPLPGGPRPTPADDRRPRPREQILRLGALTAGATVWLVVDGVAGAAAGVAATVLLARWLPGLETAADRRRRDRVARDAPVAMRLLAVCLDAGRPLDHSCEVVADALGGPLADDLRQLATAVRLGSAPEPAGSSAWDTAVHLVLRSASSGIAVSAALDVAATEARAAAVAASEAAARRAGVLVVLPLGVCFLPAFVLLGVVPLVYGIVLELLAGW